MAVTESAAFKLRLRSIQRFITGVFPSLDKVERLTALQGFVDVLGVIFPVGRNMQGPAGYKRAGT